MIRRQSNQMIEVGDILQQSYGITMPLSAHHDYWECSNCPPDSPALPPGPPPELF